ncbi:MAG: hypothetical protein ACTSWX_09920 [Promethearchaeota archaeon]
MKLFDKSPELQQNELISLFFRIKDKFKKNIDGKEQFFVPTKSDLVPYLNQNEKKLLINSNNNDFNGDECMFLTWKIEDNQKISFCEIHDLNPKMCKDYPASKGGVCLNHPERYYTMDFFNYQKRKIGFAINVLRKIYGEKVNYDIGFDIICFLMDFGKFTYTKVRDFFLQNFNLAASEFDKAVQEFIKLSLIIRINDKLESISVKEVDRLVDDIIEKYNL